MMLNSFTLDIDPSSPESNSDDTEDEDSVNEIVEFSNSNDVEDTVNDIVDDDMIISRMLVSIIECRDHITEILDVFTYHMVHKLK